MAAAQPSIEPKKILIVLHGSIGDVTRALPLAPLLRRGFPHASLAWSVEPSAYPLLQGNPAIDEIILFKRATWWKSFAPFLAEVRAGGFDLVLDLQRHLKSGIVSRASGAPRRLGFHPSDSKEGNGFFNNLHIEQYGESINKLEHYLKFADYLGIPRAPVKWEFNLTAAEWAAIEHHLARTANPFAVLFAGTRWPSKQWFPKQIAECATMLPRQFGLDVILLGANEDRELARDAMVGGADRIVDLVGKTTLREAVGIIQKAKLAVGPDTGLMHIAAAVGTPVISLWGATDPGRTGPYGFADLAIRGQAPCVPCKKRQCPIGRVCMQSIGTATIAAKATAALGRDIGIRAGHGSVV
jgi:lipopolysaccharide heptosyltransferase II